MAEGLKALIIIVVGFFALKFLIDHFLLSKAEKGANIKILSGAKTLIEEEIGKEFLELDKENCLLKYNNIEIELNITGIITIYYKDTDCMFATRSLHVAAIMLQDIVLKGEENGRS